LFVSRDVNVLLRVYKVYVRPFVEHNASTLCYIDTVENVQRPFTKRLSGLQGLSHDARLTRLEL